MLASNPDSLIFQSLYAELLLENDQADSAVAFLEPLVSPAAVNHVLTMQLAATYSKQNAFEEAAALLSRHSQQRAFDPVVWYELAEAYGLAGNIYELHLARSKYFEIVGSFQQSIEHIRLAKRQLGQNSIEQAVLDQRIRNISRIQAQEMNL